MDSGEPPPCRLAVGIATRGRAAMLAEAVGALRLQSRCPDRIVVCCTEPADVYGLDIETDVLISSPGLPRQRNLILDQVVDCDVVLFLDDDFLMERTYIAETLTAFAADPSLVATTGTLLADDTRGPGLSPEAGWALVDQAAPPADHGADRVSHGYGCNMAIRLATVRRHGVRFDERLPLYAWSEDVDFTHRLRRHGWIAKLHAARGVHLGVKHGRTPGRKLGYSQVANPIYLFRKGSYSLVHAMRSVGRNIAANAALSARPEPYVDRRGRLHGNALAMLDLVRGRLDPSRILEL